MRKTLKDRAHKYGIRYGDAGDSLAETAWLAGYRSGRRGKRFQKRVIEHQHLVIRMCKNRIFELEQALVKAIGPPLKL